MKLTFLRLPLLVGWLLCAGSTVWASTPDLPQPLGKIHGPLLAQQGQAKDDTWWKQFITWLDSYASSKTGMIQIGVLGVLFSLYIITRKDGPK